MHTILENMRLEGEQFLSRLTLMFDKSRNKGHVDLTMKRYDGRTKPVTRKPIISDKSKGKNTPVKQAKGKQHTHDSKSRSDSTSHDVGEYMCLIRAVLKTEKISCVVHSKDINKFQMAYCNLLRSNMDGLKRQKKQKTKKATQ